MLCRSVQPVTTERIGCFMIFVKMGEPETIVVSSGSDLDDPPRWKLKELMTAHGRRYSDNAGNSFTPPMNYHLTSGSSFPNMGPHLHEHYFRNSSWTPNPPLDFRPRNLSEPVQMLQLKQRQVRERQYTRPRSLLGTPPSRSSTSTSTVTGRSRESVESRKDYAQSRVVKRRHHSDITPGLDRREESKKFRRNSGDEEPVRSLKFSPFHGEAAVYTPETLSAEILEKCKMLAQTRATLEKKLHLKRGLEAAIRNAVPDSTLHLVGSSTNGFGSNESDADFCLMVYSSRKVNRYESRAILLTLQKVLKGCVFVRKSQVIFATVPILKFFDSVSKCECDININNTVGIQNTFLLRAYQQVDERVQPLIMVIKCWAKCHAINDASQGTLSSYALALMVIHYLQGVCKPPVVPTLKIAYPDLFKDTRDVTILLDEEPNKKILCGRSENIQCLGELFIGFFKYYAEEFKWSEEIISIRMGTTLPRNVVYEWRNKLICIEEPFDSNNVAKAVWSLDKFNKIKMKLSLAWSTLQISPTLESVLWLTGNQHEWKVTTPE